MKILSYDIDNTTYRLMQGETVEGVTLEESDE
jgi:hypothetical protein